MPSLKQVYNAGGPDPSRMTAAMQLSAMGMMLEVQQRTLTLSAQHFYRMSSEGLPPMRGQATLSTDQFWWMPSHNFALAVPPGDSGLTWGAGNAAVRVVAKPGWSVRFGIINPGTNGPTGTYFLASQSLDVKVSIKGKFAEIWVLAANDASIATTSTAAAVLAAILASEDAMKALSTVDFAGGTGANVVAAASSKAQESVLLAATVTDPPVVVPGRFYVSFDGDMLLFGKSQTAGFVANYIAAPEQPLAENEYPGT